MPYGHYAHELHQHLLHIQDGLTTRKQFDFAHLHMPVAKLYRNIFDAPCVFLHHEYWRLHHVPKYSQPCQRQRHAHMPYVGAADYKLADEFVHLGL